MKHWLLIGTLIIIAVVLLMRSRVSTTATTMPTTSPGVSVDQLPPSFRPATFPASRPAGISLDKLPDRYVPVPTH